MASDTFMIVDEAAKEFGVSKPYAYKKILIISLNVYDGKVRWMNKMDYCFILYIVVS